MYSLSPETKKASVFSCVLQIRAGGEISLFDLLIIFKLFHSKFSNINGISPNLVEIRIPKKFSVCKMKIQTENFFGILFSTRLHFTQISAIQRLK